MKSFIRLLLAAALVAPAALAAASFEGKVAFKITSGRAKPQEMHYQIKGDKIRVSLPGQDQTGGLIMDLEKKETLMLMDSEKMYMVMPMATEGAPDRGGKAGDAPTLEKTGETETILGYRAEKYLSTHQNEKTELWLAEGLGRFAGSGSKGGPMGGGRKGGGSAGQAWERALAGKDLFPLRVVGLDRGGKETSRMEVTAIEKQSLPDSLFVPPADYTKMDMGGMMQGMGIPGLPGLKGLPGMKR